MKKVSVILPTYNEKENIRNLIDVIFKNMKDITTEIIVVDDNSPDKTWKIVKKISDKNKNEFDIYIKIHEPDDTSILVLLIYRDKVGEQSFDRYFIQSKNDIYIAAVSYKVDHKPIPIGNSIEITVKVFNEGGLRDPNDVELILSSQSLFPHYDKRASNNDTIYKKEFWTYTFEIDNVFDDEWKFDIELRLNDEVRDEAMVYSD